MYLDKNKHRNQENAALEMFKHYSGVRFLMLPIFFTSMGAVVVAYWKLIASNNQHSMSLQLTVAFGGLILSIFFFIYEWHLSKRLTAAARLLSVSLGELKSVKRFGLITLATLFLYGTPGVFWLHIIIYKN